MSDDAHAPYESLTSRDAAERALLLETLGRLVTTLGSALPPTVEIVLHDLARIPNSIVAISGNVTRRRIGDPATDLLLQTVASGEQDAMIGYQTRLPDGTELRSSTLIVRDSTTTQVAAVCVNVDVSAWLTMRDLVEAMLQPRSATATIRDVHFPTPLAGTPSPSPEQPLASDEESVGERFAHDVDELASHLLETAVAQAGVPVELMKKSHKLAVVSQLRDRGMFLLRDAVEIVANHLGVTRFTIYNYLNELEQE